MTTKEGDRQLSAPHALSTDKAVHTVYEKGAFVGELELRYYTTAGMAARTPITGVRIQEDLVVIMVSSMVRRPTRR